MWGRCWRAAVRWARHHLPVWLHGAPIASCTQSCVTHLYAPALVDAVSKPPEGKGCNSNDPSHLHHLLHGHDTLQQARGNQQTGNEVYCDSSSMARARAPASVLIAGVVTPIALRGMND